MKKQKIQMLVVVILLVICVVAYIFISKNAGKLDSTENDTKCIHGKCDRKCFGDGD